MAVVKYQNEAHDLKIVFEDNQIIVVVKPVGLLSQADQTGDADLYNIVREYIRVKYQKPGQAWLGLVHRLDRPVGGLMVFAKTSKAASRLSAQIRNHSFIRKYQAVCHGILGQEKGLWSDHISKQKVKGKYIVNTNLDPRYQDKYQDCSLSFRRLATEPKAKLSLLEVELKTGRSHQIRAQMRAHGHVLVGDRLYGKITDLDRDTEGPALFASFLQFKHPVKEEIMVFKEESKALPFNLFKSK